MAWHHPQTPADHQAQTWGRQAAICTIMNDADQEMREQVSSHLHDHIVMNKKLDRAQDRGDGRLLRWESSFKNLEFGLASDPNDEFRHL